MTLFIDHAFRAGIEILWLGIGGVVVAAIVAGLLAALLQSVLSIHEGVISYGFKLLAVGGVIAATFTTLARLLISLTESVLR